MKNIANKFFYKIDSQGRPIPMTLARFSKKPVQGQWIEVSSNICCPDNEENFRAVPLIGAPASGCNLLSTSIPDPGNPDEDSTFHHYIRLIGQEGQGEFYVDIPVRRVSGTTFVVDSGSIHFPISHGMFKMYLDLEVSGDYPGLSLYDKTNTLLFSLISGNGVSFLSTAFDINEIDRFEAMCTSSG